MNPPRGVRVPPGEPDRARTFDLWVGQKLLADLSPGVPVSQPRSAPLALRHNRLIDCWIGRKEIWPFESHLCKRPSGSLWKNRLFIGRLWQLWPQTKNRSFALDTRRRPALSRRPTSQPERRGADGKYRGGMGGAGLLRGRAGRFPVCGPEEQILITSTRDLPEFTWSLQQPRWAREAAHTCHDGP